MSTERDAQANIAETLTNELELDTESARFLSEAILMRLAEWGLEVFQLEKPLP